MVFQKLITSGSSEGRMAVTITCSEVPGTPGSCLTLPHLPYLFPYEFWSHFPQFVYQLLRDAFVSLVNEVSTYVLPGSTMSISFLVSLSSLYTLSKFGFLCRGHLIVLSLDHVLCVEQFWSY